MPSFLLLWVSTLYADILAGTEILKKKKKSLVPPFAYQTIETTVSRKLKFSQEPEEGRADIWCWPGEVVSRKNIPDDDNSPFHRRGETGVRQ